MFIIYMKNSQTGIHAEWVRDGLYSVVTKIIKWKYVCLFVHFTLHCNAWMQLATHFFLLLDVKNVFLMCYIIAIYCGGFVWLLDVCILITKDIIKRMLFSLSCNTLTSLKRDFKSVWVASFFNPFFWSLLRVEGL